MTWMLPWVWIMALLYRGVNLSLYVILKEGKYRRENLKDWKILASFRRLLTFWSGAGLHLFSLPRASPQVRTWLVEDVRFTLYSTLIGWTVGGRAPRKSSARKVVHPITIPAWGGVPSEFPWISVKHLGLYPRWHSLRCLQCWSHLFVFYHMLVMCAFSNLLNGTLQRCCIWVVWEIEGLLPESDVRQGCELQVIFDLWAQ